MAEVGVRELKQRASEILRHVREEKETYSVTYRGKVVARLVPAEDTEAWAAEAKTDAPIEVKLWLELFGPRSVGQRRLRELRNV